MGQGVSVTVVVIVDVLHNIMSAKLFHGQALWSEYLAAEYVCDALTVVGIQFQF